MYNYFNKFSEIKITKSHLRLHQAFIGLVSQNGFEKITVNDICDKALVSRSTFYNHFEDKYHLLYFSIYQIKNQIIDSEKSITDYSKGEQIHIILSFINKNRAFFKSIISINYINLIITTLHDLTIPQYVLMLRSLEDTGYKFIVSIDFLAEFFSGAFISIVHRWLKDDNPKTIDELSFELDKVTDMHLYFDPSVQN
ncbi:TetR/AcrR family transcriptional regulator [Clostridium botulinum]|uniref:TetR/AcrR family transcriptional regulator n=1 Tax=Clostridium botulinum TaxID=1491 RepID=A0ABD7CF75_CLOBO|nr:TetR/AcrR family transcriptional regulator [Clostridium botulinum]KGO14929.1 transcriptional regulator [Clostridium botulinum]KIN82306.1 transcriptional regulator [Clostridium botulinum]MCC5427695.1 TetR/AcrR family transcriptional regulator [Clostridium botulinum]QRI51833.1 TetR/AcrR family transcriptional regulator [Clostridium botulinum]